MTRTPINNFDRIASFYDFLARLVFGDAIVRAQTCFFGDIHPGSRVLVLGGGTGLWLNELVERVVGIRIVFVDASAAMLRIARTRTNSPAVTFIHGTQADIPEGAFDVIMTPFVLDTFDGVELPAIVDSISRRLSPTGRWFATDFVSELFWHRPALACMYAFFYVTCGLGCNSLPPWRDVLARSMQCVREELYYSNFISACVFVPRNEGHSIPSEST